MLSANPSPGTAVAPGTTVTLEVSSGPSEVPDVVGLTEDAAISRIENAGLVASTTEEETDAAEDGTVTAQSPGAGSAVAPGETVTITVAVAPATTTTPPTTTTEPPTTTTEPPTTTTEPPTTEEEDEDPLPDGPSDERGAAQSGSANSSAGRPS